MASVLITGTSKGIGMATALVLGRAGHTVFATMRDPHAAPELARAAGEEGLPIHVSAMDVDSDSSVAEAVGAIEEANGPVEVLLQWRASMNDEQWVGWGAADDDTWYQSVERDFGLNARLKE